MKRIILRIWFAAILFASCSLQAKVNIVTTTSDLGAIAKAIGGDQVSVIVLAKATEDPHFVDAKPSFMVQLNKADLLIEGGAELEAGWLRPLVQGARNAKLNPGAPGHLNASEGIRLLGIPAELDRSKGDIHAHGNPHYLTDPNNAKIVAENIRKRLCVVDPDKCDAYEKNHAKFSAQLAAKIKEWQEVLAPYKGQRLVSYHDSWLYFGHAFGLKIDLHLEPKPGIPPTPSHLMQVIERIKKEKIKVIMVEPFVNKRTAQKIAAGTGATVIDTAHFPGGIKGTEGDYLKLIDKIVGSLVEAFKK